MSNNFFKKEETLVILDWDDTLLPTSWFDYVDIEMEIVKNKIDLLDDLNCKFLDIILKNAFIIIVTNSTYSWFKMTSEKFLPKTLNYINDKNIKIISAREENSMRFSDDIYMWKVSTFRDILLRNNFNNIISIGDSLYERSALFNLLNDFKKINVKNIKLKDNPSIDQLITQLNVIIISINDIYKKKINLDLRL